MYTKRQTIRQYWCNKRFVATIKVFIGIKIRLLETCVFEVSLLLYAVETWTIKKDDQRSLLAFEMRYYQSAWLSHSCDYGEVLISVAKVLSRQWANISTIICRYLTGFYTSTHFAYPGMSWPGWLIRYRKSANGFELVNVTHLSTRRKITTLIEINALLLH